MLTVDLLARWTALEPSRCQHFPSVHLFTVRIDQDWEPLKPRTASVPALVGREQGLLGIAVEQAFAAKADVQLTLRAIKRTELERSRWLVECQSTDLSAAAMRTDRVDALLDVYLQLLHARSLSFNSNYPLPVCEELL